MGKCEFIVKEVIDGKEVTYGCDKEAEGIARCKEVCRFHFNKLKQDNLYRNNREIDIPEDTSLIIKVKTKNLAVKPIDSLQKGLNTQDN